MNKQIAYKKMFIILKKNNHDEPPLNELYDNNQPADSSLCIAIKSNLQTQRMKQRLYIC